MVLEMSEVLMKHPGDISYTIYLPDCPTPSCVSGLTAGSLGWGSSISHSSMIGKDRYWQQHTDAMKLGKIGVIGIL